MRGALLPRLLLQVPTRHPPTPAPGWVGAGAPPEGLGVGPAPWGEQAAGPGASVPSGCGATSVKQGDVRSGGGGVNLCPLSIGLPSLGVPEAAPRNPAAGGDGLLGPPLFVRREGEKWLRAEARSSLGRFTKFSSSTNLPEAVPYQGLEAHTSGPA